MQRRHSHLISSFTKLRERPIRNDKQLRAIVRVGQSVNFAVERFASVGEAIADDNPEIRNEMYDACKNVRNAGALIEQLCSLTAPSLRASTATTTTTTATTSGGMGGLGSTEIVTEEEEEDNLYPLILEDHHPSSGGGGGNKTSTVIGPGGPGGTTSANIEEIRLRIHSDRQAMARAARQLLSSVTRVLLVADTVVVKQIVASKDRVSMSLNRLENVANFTEFVKAFSHFGMEMVELTRLTSDRQNDLKNEKRRAQMATARKTLERSTMMLLTTSKVCLRHPDCQTARENRDTVFAQMRRAMDLIHFVVKEGIISYQTKVMSATTTTTTTAVAACQASSGYHPQRPTSSSSSSSSLHLPFDPHNDALLFGLDYIRDRTTSSSGIGGSGSRAATAATPKIPKYQRRGQLHRVQRTVPGNSFVLAVESTLRWLHEQLDACPSIVNFLKRICELSDLAQMGQMTSAIKEQIIFAMDAALERIQDFTDSAYTNHEHRENILMLCDQLKAEIDSFFRAVVCFDDPCFQTNTVDEFDTYIMQINNITQELRFKLQDVALEQADELFRHHTTIDLPLLLKSSALDCDHEQIDELIEQFREHSDHVQEVCRLLFHISPNASLQVNSSHTETSIEIHGEQLLTALHTLLLFPNSKIVKENYEIFADVWTALIGDISQIMRDISDFLREQQTREQLTRPLTTTTGSHHPPPHYLQHPHHPHHPHHQQNPALTSSLSFGGFIPSPMSSSGRPLVAQSPSMAAIAPITSMHSYASGYHLDPHHQSIKEPMPMTGDTASSVDHPYGPGAPIPAQASVALGPELPEDPGGGPGPGPPIPPIIPLTPPTRQTNVQINPEVEVYEIEKTSTSSQQQQQQQSVAPTVDLDDNDIVRKAKAMSAMAMSMFQFTRGEGELKTTQDLFTQAEFFAEEANKLYKIVRHFTYQIPTGTAKKELLDCIDQVPTYVQQLQFAVKNVTVGKTATFTKVDNVIQETKNLMQVITNVVSACLNCANKHNLDMQGALRTRSRTLSPSYRQETEMFFEGGAAGMSKSGVTSSDPDI